MKPLSSIDYDSAPGSWDRAIARGCLSHLVAPRGLEQNEQKPSGKKAERLHIIDHGQGVSR